MTPSTIPSPPDEPIEELLSRLLDGDFADEELLHLAGFVQSNPEFRQLYCDHIALHAAMRWRSCDLEQVALTDVFAVDPVVVCQPSPRPFVASLWQGDSSLLSSGWPFAYLVATVIIALGVIVAAFTRVSGPTQFAGESRAIAPLVQELGQAAIGRITGMADCKLAGSPPVQNGGLVRSGSRYTLISGLMEIAYDTGAKVILQGPATYEVDSADGGYLTVGKLTARLESSGAMRKNGDGNTEFKPPKSKRPIASFTVHTPSAIVTDLGTEFGVEVSPERGTQVCVLQGRVVLQPSVKDSHGSVVLNKGQVSCVTPQGRLSQQSSDETRTFATVSHQFVRCLPSQSVADFVSLSDLVAGGDGFGTRAFWGINPEDASVLLALAKDTIYSSGKYERYSGNSQIDGVFIPDGRHGVVRLDSAGHAYALPPTNGVCAFWGVWSYRNEKWKAPTTTKPNSSANAHDYPMICIQSNAGITFDLAAMAQSAKGRSAAKFQTTVRNPQWGIRENETLKADFWLFVDGQLRFNRMGLCRKDEPADVDITLNPNDRYLTLVVTDAGDGIINDCVCLLDPRVILRPSTR